MQVGLEVCRDERPAVLEGARFGLVMNRASVDAELRFSCDVLNDAYPGQLAALFSPQHGMWGAAQANMIESPHGRHDRLGIPIYSLYSETRRPSPRMLDDLDCLVVDLQDVGTRVYTFIWTVLECLRECAASDVDVLVLDRPNPIGRVVEGPLLVEAFRSFVGGAMIPMRHGLTMGELTHLCNDTLQIGANLQVVSVRGWNGASFPWGRVDDETRHWIPPSPNLPSVESTLLYPGQVLLEGTNLSEGRGTTTPFQVAGAPYVDAERLSDSLNAFDLPGVRFLPIQFLPTFDKWTGELCHGVSMHITDSTTLRAYRTAVLLIATVRTMWPEEFAWTEPPYEYETVKPPIDILSGGDLLRTTIDGLTQASVGELHHLWQVDRTWSEITLRYRPSD